MPAKKKPTASKKTSKSTNAFDHSSYVELRTVLDGLELGAIRHYLAGKSATERQNRSDYITELLRPIARQLVRGAAAPAAKLMAFNRDGGDVMGGGCPEGLHDCNGVCVAYECPNSGGQ
jgi:hypothetical protein